MKSSKNYLSFIFCVLLSLSFTIPSQAFGPVTTPTPGKLYSSNPNMSLKNLSSASIKGVQDSQPLISYHSGTGKVRFMAAPSNSTLMRAPNFTLGSSPEKAARSFMIFFGDRFGLQDQSRELKLLWIRQLEKERSIVRFQQVYQDIPVLGGELILKISDQGDVLVASGEILPDIHMDINPELDPETACAKARQFIGKQYNLQEETLQTSTPELWIYNPILLNSTNYWRNTLVWLLQITSSERLDIREFVLVDAKLGFVVLNFNQIDSIRNRKIYDNQNNPSYGLPGNGPVRTEGSAATGILEVDNAYDYSGFTYDFYNSFHGRDSLDNYGMPLLQTIHYCPDSYNCPYDNAFWNGYQMVYGDGYASADDVVAHEMTHGVTDFESNLFYYMQSGAINESFSDIWGEFVDLSYTNGHDDDTPGVRWLMGEDIGTLRSMSDPPTYGDPDRMTSGNYYCGSDDGGGVHTNSGVGNKTAYLITDGGVFNGFNITGIGITKTAKIFYRVQTSLLTSGADYQDLHDALNYACTSMIGSSGISESDCDQVRKAIAATELYRQPTACPAPEAPLCDTSGFDSQFNDSADGWNVVSGTWTPTSSYYTTPGEAEKYSSISRANNFTDFDYQVRMRRSGCSACANSLYIRGLISPLLYNDDWYSAYQFSYSNNGSFSVWRWEGSQEFELKSWTFSEAIQISDWNILRVVTKRSDLYFYINDVLVWSGSDTFREKGDVGISMYRDAYSSDNLLEVDWARLTGGSPVYLFLDRFESEPENWYSAAYTGYPEWYWSYGYATSGKLMLYGWDPDIISDFYVAMNRDVGLPSGLPAYFHFDHAYDFETGWDGGVIEYSSNSGGDWYDASPYFTHNGYNGVLETSSNPLNGRNAFTGSSQGYQSSRLNLSSFVGNDLRFRYRIGADSSVSDLGWIIDDVGVYICSAISNNVFLPSIARDFAGVSSGFNYQFNSDAANWQAHRGTWSLAGGYYRSYGVSNGSASASHNATFSNFNYQARMRRNGCAECSNRLIVRGTPDPLDTDGRWYNQYIFQYVNDGYISVFRRINGGDSESLLDWQYSPFVNQGYNWNTMRVLADGPSYSFYINDVLVWSGVDASITSGRVGLGFYRSSDSTGDILEVDWAELSIPSFAIHEPLRIWPGIPLIGQASSVNDSLLEGDENRLYSTGH